MAILVKLAYTSFSDPEDSGNSLNELINYLLSNYQGNFTDNLIPSGKSKNEYLADVIRVLALSEA
jgi:hypothetical protein